MSDADIAYMPVAELVEKFRAKEISPVEATRAALDRIDMHNDKVNAFCYLDEDGALASAKESEARWAKGEPIGLIDGVPLGVKDTLHAKGMPTRFGSHTTTDEPATEDTSTTLACRNHGAVLLGKTTNPEFAIGPTTNSPLTGLTTNPWDPTKHAGGSTGGGAAAVAAGMGNTSLATDAGGSTRIPAALCGKVGFKATQFRVPTYPPPGMPSLSCPGAVTHTVTDTAIMMNVMTEPDPRDWLASKPDGVDYLAGLEDGIKGLKIAFSPTLNGQAKFIDPEVAASVATAVDAFKELGATVEEADPDIESPIPILSSYLISRITHRVNAMTDAQRDVLGPSINAVIKRSEGVTMLDMVEADERRQILSKTLIDFMRDYDLLLTPTLTVPAFDAERLSPVEFEKFEDPRAWVPFCSPFNLSQQPAITMLCGFTEAGLPIALQIVSPRHEDTRVLRAARAYEKLNPLWERRPNLD